GSLVAAGLVALLAHAHSVLMFYLIWVGLGCAMAAVLYEPAFAVIYQSFGVNAKKAVTALTLAAGFASTLFWPLTQGLVDALGWRTSVSVLAALNLLICLPLHVLALPQCRQHAVSRSRSPNHVRSRTGTVRSKTSGCSR